MSRLPLQVIHLHPVLSEMFPRLHSIERIFLPTSVSSLSTSAYGYDSFLTNVLIIVLESHGNLFKFTPQTR